MFNIIINIINIIILININLINIIINKFEKIYYYYWKKKHRFDLKNKIKNYYYYSLESLESNMAAKPKTFRSGFVIRSNSLGFGMIARFKGLKIFSIFLIIVLHF